MKFTFQPEARPLEGFTLKRAIARGGFGEVYYALSDAGKEVALKLLQQNLDVELRGVRQCLNLRHPHLVMLFDIKTDAEGDSWVVMEYISGPTLEQTLQQNPQGMPIDLVLRWAEGIVRGLEFLHDRGIVHRDLKPANLFWDQGLVKIGDVGLSKFITPSRRSAHTESVGTVYYMAPEIAYGKYGYEVDLYSLGVILFEMVTGRVPFDGESTAEIMMKHLSQVPDLTALPIALRPLIGQLLEKDPQRRPQSITEVWQEFLRATADLEGASAARISDSNPPNPERLHATTGHWPGTAPPPLPPKRESATPFPVQAAAPCVAQPQRAPWHQVAVTGVLFVAGFSILGPMIIIAPLSMGLMLLMAGGVFTLITGQHLGRVAGRYWGRACADWSQLWSAISGTAAPGVPPSATVQHDPVPVREVPPIVKTPIARISHKSLHYSPETQRYLPWSARCEQGVLSLFWVSVLTAVLCLGTSLVSPIFGTTSDILPDAGRVGVFTLLAWLGAGSVIVISKVAEGARSEHPGRRLWLILAGIVLGTTAWGLCQFLMVNFPRQEAAIMSLGRQPLTMNGSPTWLCFALYFGALFGSRRWWWLADGFRKPLFSISAVIWTVVLAGLWSLVLPFPGDWGMTLAAVIACVVQMSAVWIPPEQRQPLPLPVVRPAPQQAGQSVVAAS